MHTQTDKAEQGRQLDQLIPPPWPRARTVAVGVAVLALAVLLPAAWWAGLLGPRLERPLDGNATDAFTSPDGELVAARRVQLRNAGRLPVEIRAFAPPELDGIQWHPVEPAPPELDGIEWHPVEPALPVTLQRGESVFLWVAFTAQSCAVDGGGLEHFPMLARSGLLPARVVAVNHGPGSRGHRADQEPSWVLDMISSRCTEVPLEPDSQPDSQVEFVSPADGDTVSSPFTVELRGGVVTTGPSDDPAIGDPHFFSIHVGVDTSCVEDGEVVPGPGEQAEADGYFHLGDGIGRTGLERTELELEAGTYDLCLQLADGAHRAFGGTDEITITVE